MKRPTFAKPSKIRSRVRRLTKNVDRALVHRVLPRVRLLRRFMFSLRRYERIRDLYIDKWYHVDSEAACLAYRRFNADAADAEDNLDRELITQAVRLGYLSWPRKVQTYVRGRSVLDVGCGRGMQSIGYIVAGAKSYTGLDPSIALDSDRAKSKRTNRYGPFGATPRDIMRRMPRIRLVPGTFEDIAPDERFDLIVLHNVTEHLANIETVFEGVKKRLARHGKIIFHHHNFYSWDGHHLPPRTIDQIDVSDPAQRDVVDWNHLTFEAPEGHYIRRGLNKIRLDELRALTSRLFEIESWDEIVSTEREGRNRLTSDIIERHREFSERELLVKNVLCIARHKDEQRAARIDEEPPLHGESRPVAHVLRAP